MKVYITFGQEHTHSVGGVTLDKDCVAVVDCVDYAAGRAMAFDLFKNKWSNCSADCVAAELYPRGFFAVTAEWWEGK